MTAWRGLLWKDTRLILPWFLGGLALILLFDVWVTLTVDSPNARFGLSLFPLFSHFFYYPLYLMITLRVEGKQMHQWLHNPHPAWQLLLSKTGIGFPLMVFSLGVSGLYPSFVLITHDFFQIHSVLDPVSLWMDVGSFLIGIVGYSLNLGIILLLLWSIYRWLHTWWGKWTWVPLAGGFIAILYGFSQIMKTALYDTLFRWGATWPQFHSIPESQPSAPGLYTGELLLNMLLLALFFFLSGRILDRRMEV
ncbi:MAG: hypothetical protein M0Z65_02450 [Firmicutes bacterium]|uniref:ABC-2 type transport system permease protein n=1 Tax=Melghirimyces thermohalophilus TaxID=1236220 RepID=A0A1G6QIE6_9BACL|nr:hypothetical protein [Melghirimyces thermohalophilus]MDA8352055.1 hypothetical protein [Bacillota bacterium]SDC91457.1 hypothetical protein SAMN04488112_12160 [Melghirimyces thermohalophilus]